METNPAFETRGPQWIDFQTMTPGYDNESADDFFNCSHDSLEAFPKKKYQTRKSTRLQKSGRNTSVTETPKNKNAYNKTLQSTFMDDIDNIEITPLKLISPKTKNNEAVVLKEVNVNELLSEATAVMQLLSSQKKRTKPPNEVRKSCPKIEITADTPSRRKIRISKSMHNKIVDGIIDTPEKIETPIDKKMHARRSTRIQKLQEPEIKTEETLENTKENVNLENSLITKKNLNKSISSTSLQDNNLVKRKIRLGRSMHQSTPIGRMPIYMDTSPCSLNLQVSNIVCDDQVDKCHMDEVKMEVESEQFATDQLQLKLEKTILEDVDEIDCEQKIATEELLMKSVNGNDEEQAINIPDLASLVITDNKIDDEQFQELSEFNKTLDEQEEEYKIHKCHHEEVRPRPIFKASVLAGQARRNSIKLNQIKLSRKSHKYVSLAEGVTAFQRSTPTRFHTKSKKAEDNQKPALKKKTQVQRNAAPKRTIPRSPVWHSKPRVKTTAPEKTEVKPANVKTKASTASSSGTSTVAKPMKEIVRKPPTVPKPFKFSQTKTKTVAPASTSTATSARAASSTISRPTTATSSKPSTIVSRLAPATKIPRSTAANPSKASSSSTAAAAPNTFLKPSSTAPPKPPKRIPKSTKLVLRDGENHVINTHDISGFGIPIVLAPKRTELKKKITQPIPFGLEERNKKFLDHKEQKIKKMHEEEEAKKTKSDFHARPLPTSAKKPVKTEVRDNQEKKDKVQKVYSQIVKPFSFEERDKMLAKKKEETIQKMLEEQKKIKAFHANPVPHFKPVAVRATSRENLRHHAADYLGNKSCDANYLRAKSAENLCRSARANSNDNLKVLQPIVRGKSADNLKHISRMNSNENIRNGKSSGCYRPRNSSTSELKSNGDQPENETSNMPTLKPRLKPLPIKLHSEQRAQARREYEEKLRLKEEEATLRRRLEEERILAKEQEEIARLRKEREYRAKPMPVYKPIAVIKSNKALTDPQSPDWTRPAH